MNIRKIYLPVLLSLSVGMLHGQPSPSYCDSICVMPSQRPSYIGGDAGLLTYFGKELGGILSECAEKEGVYVDNMHLKLLISREGQVLDIDFMDLNIPDKYIEQMRIRLKTMSGWLPAHQGESDVCAEFHLRIACIKWN